MMGSVRLAIADVQNVVNFYTKGVGLSVLEEGSARVVLGLGNTEIVVLNINPTLRSSNPGSTGLYHLAIVFESRAALVAALERIFRLFPELYQGSADHLVSEAFYFSDPEGNGVELYFDKEPRTWIWENGQVKMDTLYIEVGEYIAKNRGEMSGSAKIGHIHLKVGSIELARQFYVDVLGFSVTAELSSALFLSDGIYHHHIGLNVWESAGAGAREPSLGLDIARFYVIHEDMTSLADQLKSKGLEFEENDGAIIVSDPWKNRLSFEYLKI